MVKCKIKRKKVDAFFKGKKLLDEDVMVNTKMVLNMAVSKQGEEVDSPFLIGGKENWGKSDFILNCVDILDSIKGTETPIENIARNLYEFAQALSNNHSKSVLVLDEGKELDSKATMKGESLNIENTFTVIRKRAHISFIAFTNPLKIQRYYKEDRARGVFICKKPFVYFYSDNQLNGILNTLKKHQSLNINTFFKYTPRWKERYPRYKGRLRASYDLRKDVNIDYRIEMLLNNLGVKRETVSATKASRMLGLSQETVIKMIKEGELYAERLVTPYKQLSYKIPVEEVMRFARQRKIIYPLKSPGSKGITPHSQSKKPKTQDVGVEE